MNRFVTSGITALAITAGVFAGPALARSGIHAGEHHPENDDLYDTAQAGSAPAAPLQFAFAASDAQTIDGQIRHLPPSRYNVIKLDLVGRNRSAGVISDRMSERGYISALHSSIEKNRPLLARLEEQNVEIRNVIGAEPASDGSMTFYVQ